MSANHVDQATGGYLRIDCEERQVQSASGSSDDAAGQLRHRSRAEIVKGTYHCRVKRDDAETCVKILGELKQAIDDGLCHALALKQEDRFDQHHARY